ncbi:MAG: GxxExxY protein [Candidatus Cloacimonetes bacterium]|nr:GxxExxY protein [Candidatus Cloacimonadota bacterium]
MNENEIGNKIRGACFSVYNALGPGLLESAYEKAMVIELTQMGCAVKTQVPLNLTYKDQQIDCAYRLDLLAEDKVIVEIKSIDALMPVHHKQLLTYLKLSGLKLGYIVNFNTTELDKNLLRYVNQL